MFNVTEFKNALKNGEVLFKFKKKDGTIREARGTLKADLLPKVEVIESESDQPKKKRVIDEDVIFYYDLDKLAWRSFRFEQFILD
jgi:hypothetical protein